MRDEGEDGVDSRVINRKAAEYGDRKLRITPGVIAQLGLVKRGTHLKIDEFFISAIPFDLSLTGASLLAFLSENEIGFFKGMEGRPHRLNLVFKIPSASKPANFFVLSDIVALRKPNPDSPYAFIDLNFREPPFVLKEILVEYFVAADEGEAFFGEEEDPILSLDRLGELLDEPRLSLLKEGVEAPRLRVVSLSKKRLRVFGEYEGGKPDTGEILELEGKSEGEAYSVRGSCVEFTPLEGVQGFAYLGLELLYNPYLVNRLRKILTPAQTRQAKSSGRA